MSSPMRKTRLSAISSSRIASRRASRMLSSRIRLVLRRPAHVVGLAVDLVEEGVEGRVGALLGKANGRFHFFFDFLADGLDFRLGELFVAQGLLAEGDDGVEGAPVLDLFLVAVELGV